MVWSYSLLLKDYIINLYKNFIDQFYMLKSIVLESALYKDIICGLAESEMYKIVTNTIRIIVSTIEIQSKYSLARSVPLLEGLILMDGGINAIKFVKEYTIYVLAEANIKDKEKTMSMRNELVRKCSKMYKVALIDRYLFYLIICLVYAIISMITDHISSEYCKWDKLLQSIYIVCYGVVFPNVQNRLLELSYVKRFYTNFCRHKRIFIRYSASKIVVKFMSNLDKNISDIKNYHIFVLYSQVSWKQLYGFVKSYAFISLLCYLRSMEMTYYYYKAIKLAYYYKSGYLFNVLGKEDALYIVNNIIIKEKRWKDVTKVEVVNAFYTLISAKFKMEEDKSKVMIGLLKFFSLWSLVSMLKLFVIQINSVWIVLYMFYNVIKVISTKESDLHKQNILNCVVLYVLFLMNVNDLIIISLYFGRNIIYYVIQELKFYIVNNKNIIKVLQYYYSKEIKSKQA